MTAIRITKPGTEDTDPLHPLYKLYAGQSNPQGVFIALDAYGTVSIDYDTEIGNAVRMDVAHGVSQRWHVPAGAQMSAETAGELLDNLGMALQFVHDGTQTKWDGSNTVGRMTDEGACASAVVEALCQAADADDGTSVADAGDWWEETRDETVRAHNITAQTTDAELVAIETALDGVARADSVTVHNTGDWLEQVREEMRREAE